MNALPQAQEKSKLKKTSAPNWVSYFGRAKKKIRVVACIEAYAKQVDALICFEYLTNITKECNCSISTVYKAVDSAIEFGIIERVDNSIVKHIHPITKNPWFFDRVLLHWIFKEGEK